MAEEMRNAAILVDWDNIRGRLSEGFWCHEKELPGQLAERASAWAQERKVALTTRLVVAREGCIGGDFRAICTQAGFTVVDAPKFSQSADMHIFATALELAATDQVNDFLVVAQDKGYRALAHTLHGHGRSCSIWAFSKELPISNELSEYQDLEYLQPMLDLGPCPPASTDMIETLMLVLAYNRRECWDVFRTQRAVLRLKKPAPGLESEAELRRAWDDAERMRYFVFDLPRASNNDSGDRRIAVERSEVRTLLAEVDCLLLALAASTARFRGAAPISEVLGEAANTGIEAGKARWYIDVLVAAEALQIDQADDVNFKFPAARFGYLNALRRVAAMAESRLATARASSPQSGLAKDELISAWASHGAKRPNPDERQRRYLHLHQQGLKAIALAVSNNLLYDPDRRREHNTLLLREGHPITLETRSGMRKIVALLAAHGGERAKRSDFIEEMASAGVGERPSERKEPWLGLMAAERHITQSSKGDWVALQHTPLVDELLGDASSGPDRGRD